MVVGLYMYMHISPFIAPAVTGFGVQSEVMEAQSTNTINYPCSVAFIVRGCAFVLSL